MVGAVGFPPDESVDVGVRLDLGTRQDFGAAEPIEGLLSEDLARELDALPELPHVDVWKRRRSLVVWSERREAASRHWCPGRADCNVAEGRTGGEVVWLQDGVIQRVGALQLQPANAGAPHWSDVNLNPQQQNGLSNLKY